MRIFYVLPDCFESEKMKNFAFVSYYYFSNLEPTWFTNFIEIKNGIYGYISISINMKKALLVISCMWKDDKKGKKKIPISMHSSGYATLVDLISKMNIK